MTGMRPSHSRPFGGFGWRAGALGSLVACSVLAACGFEDAPKPPSTQDALAAWNHYVADREGSTDSRGRYKGPRVLKVSELKCDMANEKDRTYRCKFKYTIKRRVNEIENGEQHFRKIPVKVEERGKTVEKKMWRVVGK